MPTWKDSLEEQQQQYPALLNWQPDHLAAAQQGRMPTDEPSFNQWARSLAINPTGAVDNLMAAMQLMSVSNLAADSGKDGSSVQHVESKQPAAAEV